MHWETTLQDKTSDNTRPASFELSVYQSCLLVKLKDLCWRCLGPHLAWLGFRKLYCRWTSHLRQPFHIPNLKALILVIQSRATPTFCCTIATMSCGLGRPAKILSLATPNGAPERRVNSLKNLYRDHVSIYIHSQT